MTGRVCGRRSLPLGLCERPSLVEDSGPAWQQVRSLSNISAPKLTSAPARSQVGLGPKQSAPLPSGAHGHGPRTSEAYDFRAPSASVRIKFWLAGPGSGHGQRPRIAYTEPRTGTPTRRRNDVVNLIADSSPSHQHRSRHRARRHVGSSSQSVTKSSSTSPMLATKPQATC